MLAVLLTLSVLVWRVYENTALDREKRRFGEHADNVTKDIAKQFDRYNKLLWGCAGLFPATAEVTREIWQAYYEYRQIPALYPGIESIGFARVIRPAQLARHIEEIRAEGFPDYTVRPEGARDLYTPVIFIEPFDEQSRRIFGHDLLSEPVYRAVLERARDSGEITVSEMVKPAAENGWDTRPTFLMVVPIYAKGMPLTSSEERRAASEGYVLGAFILDDLLRGIFTESAHMVDFEIYDGARISPETLLLDSRVFSHLPGDERRPMFTSQKTLELYGHQWTLAFASMPAFEATVDRYTSQGILAAGLLLSLLFFFYLRTLESTGDRALSLAREMTSALRESEEKYRLLTENIIDVIWTADLEGRLTYISPAIEKMLGYTPEEIMEMPMRAYIVREDYDTIMAKLAEELAKSPAERVRSVTIQARCKTKDNRFVHIELKLSWILDGQGNFTGIQGSTRDISAHKQLEEQLLQSKQLFRSVVDTQQEMICRYLPDTTLTFVNDAYCRAFGKTRQELLGRKYLDFLPPQVHGEEMELLNSLTPGKTGPIKEYLVSLADGSTRWQEWSDYALFTAAGELKEIQGIGRDITERKQAEEEIRRQARRTEALLESASHLNAELELENILHILCQEVRAALHVPLSAFFLYDSKGRAFKLAAASGLPPEVTGVMGTLPRAASSWLIKRLGKAGTIPDLAALPDLPNAALIREHGINSCVYAIMERRGSPVGILFAGAAGEAAGFPQDAAQLLAGLADQAASALANARLYKELQERLRQLQALRNIDMAITGSLDLRVTFQVVLDEITSMLKIDAAAILRLDPHTGILKYKHWRGFKSSDLRSVNLPLGEGYGGRCALERQPIYIPDLRENEPDPAQGALTGNEGFAAYYAVPLVVKGSVQGVLEIFHRQPLDSNGNWLAFLETLAGQAAIAIDNAELFSRLERSSVALLRAYDATIEGWARALDLKDEETEGHSRRVTEMTVFLAGKMGVAEEELAHVRRGALLHDIGKMGIPDAVLLKPGKLTDEEWEIMRRHPRYAYEMLSPIEYLRPALDIPYCHHEKWDGSGYPRGLQGEQIPLAARIFAVVDVYDALTSERPYRRAWSKGKTLEHIQQQGGKHFDPRVLELFLRELGR